MGDVVTVQVRFKKGIFTCKNCGHEDIVDWSATGGNTYENNCSECGTWTNDFRNYDGLLSYSKAEYEKVAEKDVTSAKTTKVADWLYEVKHPPAYVEPSKEDLEQEKASLEARVSELQTRISAKVSEQIEVK